MGIKCTCEGGRRNVASASYAHVWAHAGSAKGNQRSPVAESAPSSQAVVGFCRGHHIRTVACLSPSGRLLPHLLCAHCDGTGTGTEVYLNGLLSPFSVPLVGSRHLLPALPLHNIGDFTGRGPPTSIQQVGSLPTCHIYLGCLRASALLLGGVRPHFLDGPSSVAVRVGSFYNSCRSFGSLHNHQNVLCQR